MWSSLKLKLSKAHAQKGQKSQEGSALIIGVLTFWMIIYAISMVGHVSQAIGRKIKAQIAADTAALAGAQIMANNLSTIAWINESRAILHYRKVRYGADLAVAGTMAILKTRLPDMSDGSLGPAIEDHVLAPGLGDFSEHFLNTFEQHSEVRQALWEQAFPEHWPDPSRLSPVRQVRGQSQEEQLARLQHSIGIITKTMVEKEIYDKAQENGATMSCYFPHFAMMPEPGMERTIKIQAIYDQREIGEENHIVSGWRMFNEQDGLNFLAQSVGDKRWEIQYQRGDTFTEVEMEQDDPSDGWITIVYRRTVDGATSTENMYINAELGLIITDDMQLEIEELDDGSTRITRTQNGVTTSFRYRYENGELLVFDPDTGTFENPNSNVNPDGSDSVNIDGTEVRVENFNHIAMEGATFWIDRVAIGEFTVHYRHPVRIVSHVYGYNVLAENDRFRINGLHTQNATCTWQRLHYWNAHDDDRFRHRLCTDIEGREWTYEIREDGSYLGVESVEDDDLPFNDRYSELHGKALVTGSHLGENPWDDLFVLETGQVAVNDFEQPIYTLQRPCYHPEDKNCQFPHQDLNTSWCTPVPGVANGRYHGAFGQQIVCNVCQGTGVATASLRDLVQLPTVDNNRFNAMPPEIQAMVLALQHYPAIIDSIRRQPSTMPELPPLILKEEYFKYGISVGTYIASGNSLGYDGDHRFDMGGADDAFDNNERRGNRNRFQGQFESESNNGIFAFATARAGYVDPYDQNIKFSFSDNVQRQDWLNSKENLYVANWVARLVPMKTQIKSMDIDANEDTDSGLTYLLRRLSTAEWRTHFLGRNQRLPFTSNQFNVNDLDVYELIQH